MLGIYLLVTLFSQFSPNYLSTISADSLRTASSSVKTAGLRSLWSATEPLRISAPSTLELEVSFEHLYGISSGTPVYVDGKQLGHVLSVTERPTPESGAETAQSSSHAKTPPYLVAIELKTAPGTELSRGTIALQASLLTKATGKPLPIVELLSPPTAPGNAPTLVARGERIQGYTSCEDFWSAANPTLWD